MASAETRRFPQADSASLKRNSVTFEVVSVPTRPADGEVPFKVLLNRIKPTIPDTHDFGHCPTFMDATIRRKLVRLCTAKYGVIEVHEYKALSGNLFDLKAQLTSVGRVFDAPRQDLAEHTDAFVKARRGQYETDAQCAVAAHLSYCAFFEAYKRENVDLPMLETNYDLLVFLVAGTYLVERLRNRFKSTDFGVWCLGDVYVENVSHEFFRCHVENATMRILRGEKQGRDKSGKEKPCKPSYLDRVLDALTHEIGGAGSCESVSLLHDLARFLISRAYCLFLIRRKMWLLKRLAEIEARAYNLEGEARDAVLGTATALCRDHLLLFCEYARWFIPFNETVTRSILAEIERSRSDD